MHFPHLRMPVLAETEDVAVDGVAEIAATVAVAVVVLATAIAFEVLIAFAIVIEIEIAVAIVIRHYFDLR
jgi:hypothetical protein